MRLSDVGLHLTDVDIEGDPIRARWNGPTRPDDVEPTYRSGDSIVAFDSNGTELELNVGDQVELSGGRKGDYTEVGTVNNFFEDDAGDFWLACNWFWRPSAINPKVLKTAGDIHPRELFLGIDQKLDENLVASVELCVLT